MSRSAMLIDTLSNQRSVMLLGKTIAGSLVSVTLWGFVKVPPAS